MEPGLTHLRSVAHRSKSPQWPPTRDTVTTGAHSFQTTVPRPAVWWPPPPPTCTDQTSSLSLHTAGRSQAHFILFALLIARSTLSPSSASASPHRLLPLLCREPPMSITPQANLRPRVFLRPRAKPCHHVARSKPSHRALSSTAEHFMWTGHSGHPPAPSLPPQVPPAPKNLDIHNSSGLDRSSGAWRYSGLCGGSLRLGRLWTTSCWALWNKHWIVLAHAGFMGFHKPSSFYNYLVEL
jgi:hypothetical protein